MKLSTINGFFIAAGAKLFEDAVNALAAKYNLTITSVDNQQSPFLLVNEKGYQLMFPQQKWKPIVIDFNDVALQYRLQHNWGRRQPLAKAIGIANNKALKILDATAGFGKDAFLLATLGAKLFLIEQNPLMFLLLQQAVDNAKHNLQTKATSRNIIGLICADNTAYINKINADEFDIIYLDPMYPPSPNTALVKKEMQALHLLLHPETTADNDNKLLELALKKAKKVVVKRPAYAPPLGNISPAFSIKSPNTRFDVYT